MTKRRGRKRSTGNRHPGGQLVREPALDHGTKERWRKPLVLELEETMTAGVLRARSRYECLLDVLLHAGDLGEGQEAGVRYTAGIWLRQLYLKTHGPNVVGAYGQQTAAAYEISDDLAAALALYRRTIVEMGPEFAVLRQVCCDDRPARLNLLNRALDRLAKWRGI